MKEAETLDLHRDEIKQVIEAARLADDIPSQAEVFRVITLADAARVKAANGVDEQEKRQEKSTPKPYLNRNEARAGDEQKLTKEEKSLADKIQPPDELMRFERYQTALKKVNASLATILKVYGPVLDEYEAEEFTQAHKGIVETTKNSILTKLQTIRKALRVRTWTEGDKALADQIATDLSRSIPATSFDAIPAEFTEVQK